ncbi:MAG: tripartite tricarboxylate transporter substrate binding protein [Desulfovibrio sp.]|jgi:tripartite-type tricarboxylate transporter receptor subunit TctC|nr:tripartite tricarboxylate transporter substrate binding protein [Desulfovibrio sp.]
MKKLSALIPALFFFIFAATADAAFPEKDIRIIVPFGPGGGVDVTVRMLAEVAPRYLNNRQLIVENVADDGTVLGQTAAAEAAPDGYTLLSYTTSVVSNPIEKATVFSYKDFKIIIMYCFDPEVLVVPAGSPYADLKSFIAAEKMPLNIATSGDSTTHHIASRMMEKHFKLDFVNIHTPSAPYQVAKLTGGEADGAMMSLGETMRYVKDGSVRMLGIMSDAAYDGAENLARFSGLGFTTEWGSFRGVAAPAGTPESIVAFLKKAFEGMVNDPLFLKRMKENEYPVVVKTAEEFGSYVDGVAAYLKQVLPSLRKTKLLRGAKINIMTTPVEDYGVLNIQ